ncbi:MAG: alcohol dehydrogenase [Ilumatobacteraceae bacterium]|nr:alcohol dehydrogenase [Ilumatobacteraceae bacterium]
MRAYLLQDWGTFAYGDIPRYTDGDDLVNVAPVFVGLCGSDVHIARGLRPNVKLPLAIGHEIVGVALDGQHAGKRVAIDPVEGCGHCPRCAEGHEQLCPQLRIIGSGRHGGLAESVAVHTRQLHLIPDGISMRLAGLTEALAVAVHAVDRSGLRDGDTAIIVGGGPIGALIALAARGATNARIIVVEPAEHRRTYAAQLGFDCVAGVEPRDQLMALVGGAGADVVFDAAGHSSLPPLLTDLVRAGGVVVIVGIYHHAEPVDLPAVALRELTVIGTRACTGPDMAGALRLLVQRPDEFETLVDDVVQPEGVAESIERLQRGETMKVLVDCRGMSGAEES